MIDNSKPCVYCANSQNFESLNIMDVGSKSGYPASALSNFSPHAFVFQGVECASMEGFLQSLKFDKEHIQVEVCKLVGFAAKARGKPRNKAWQTKQTLWWKGVPYGRGSEAYENLLVHAYSAMWEQSDSFRRAIAAAGDAIFTHSIGNRDETKTVLTEREFVRMLNFVRKLHNRKETV